MQGVSLNPRGIAITEGYVGVRQAVQQLKRIRGEIFKDIDIGDEFRDGDVCYCVGPRR